MLLQNRYTFFGLLCLILLLSGVVLLIPSLATAQPASFYQKELKPVEMRLLFQLQELSGKGEYAKGLQKLNKFVESRQPEQKLPPLLGFVAGNLNFQLGNYQAAVMYYRRVVEQAPEFALAYENYGMALLQVEDYPAAGRTLLQAAAMIPKKSRKLKYRAAIAFLYGQELEKSRALLVELTSSVGPIAISGSASAHLPPADWLKALLQVNWQLADYKAAVAVAEKLVDSYPGEIGFWRLYGQVALAAVEYRKALCAYKVLQSSGSISLSERRQIAGIYQRLELYPEAAEILEEIFVEVDPDRIELQQLIATYRQAGEVEKALTVLDRLQKLYPDSMNLFQRGEIFYAAGRYQEAAQVFLSLKKISKNDGRQYILAGYCAWNLDDFPAAASAWRKAATYPAWQKQALDLLQTLKPWLTVESD